jgi:hypothetical protein
MAASSQPLWPALVSQRRQREDCKAHGSTDQDSNHCYFLDG